MTLELLKNAVEHPDFNPSFHRVFDLRYATIDLSLEEMVDILTSPVGTSFNPAEESYRVAYVVNDSTEFSFMELFVSIRERTYDPDKPGQVFLNLDRAKYWAQHGDKPKV